jgi:Tol biopolymer transport system component
MIDRLARIRASHRVATDAVISQGDLMMARSRFRIPRAVLIAGALACGALNGCDESRDPAAAPVPVPARLEALSATTRSGVVASAMTPPPAVRLTDREGDPMPGVDVAFEFFVGSAVDATTTVGVRTDITGAASVAWTLGTAVGDYSVIAHSADVPSVTFRAVAAVGPLARMTAGGTMQRGPAGSVLPSPLWVRVTDAYSNPIPDLAVTFTVLSGGGSIAGATVLSNPLGVATSGAWTLGMIAGMQQVSARAGSITTIFSAEALTEPCTVTCPGGGQIAFVRNGSIYHITPQGTDLVQLTSSGIDATPAWSPDGRRVAFTRSGAAQFGWGDVHVMDADGANVMRLTQADHGRAPAWSPDGHRIVFHDLCDGDSCLHVRNASADGGIPVRLGNPRGYNADPAWSPDGSRIAFVSDYVAYDFVFDIYVTASDGSSITQLTNGFDMWPQLTYSLHPAWSPDGSRIAFVRGRIVSGTAMRFEVMVMNADGSERKVVAWAGDIDWMNLLDPGSLSWSPDGSRIAFTSVDCDLVAARCSKMRSIRYVTVDGGQGGLIVSNASDPSWRR